VVKIGHSPQHQPKARHIPPDQRIDNAEAQHEQADDPVIDGGSSIGEPRAADDEVVGGGGLEEGAPEGGGLGGHHCVLKTSHDRPSDTKYDYLALVSLFEISTSD
jgi:hypothetical protein